MRVKVRAERGETGDREDREEGGEGGEVRGCMLCAEHARFSMQGSACVCVSVHERALMSVSV